MSTALCLDIGGTNFRAGLATRGDEDSPKPLGNWSAPGELKEFQQRVGELANEHAVSHLGIGIPGYASGTEALWVPNLPYLDGVDMQTLFPDLEIAVGNDAHLALVAEATHGVAKGEANVLLVAIGTGIGSALLTDGRILKGHNGTATSLGWACLNQSDTGEDSHGWLERHASGRALDHIACEMNLEDGAALIDAARSGDDGALHRLRPPAQALGTALAGAVALTGSRMIVITGGVAESLDVLGPIVRTCLTFHLPPHMREVTIRKAAYGPQATLVGAGIAALGHSIWREVRNDSRI